MNEHTRPTEEPARESSSEVAPLLPPLVPMSEAEYQRARWIARMGRAHAAWQRKQAKGQRRQSKHPR